jgi:hypothetical protein
MAEIFAVDERQCCVSLGDRCNIQLCGCLQVDHVPEKGDVCWKHATTITYPVLFCFVGLVTGMFGVGGGIVKVPLLLNPGVLPDAQSATSVTMILFTACAPLCASCSVSCLWSFAPMR